MSYAIVVVAAAVATVIIAIVIIAITVDRRRSRVGVVGSRGGTASMQLANNVAERAHECGGGRPCVETAVAVRAQLGEAGDEHLARREVRAPAVTRQRRG